MNHKADVIVVNRPPPVISEQARENQRADREQWSNGVEYYLSCLGYCVGLGNLWRFPYLCMKYGGGAFLIPYTTFLIICGLPLYMAESVLGQYTGLSAIKCFNFAPFIQGVGWAMIVLSGVLCIYYNVIMAWVFFFLGSSFQWQLPWSTCDNEWNTEACRQIISVNESSIIEGWTWDSSRPVNIVSVYRGTNVLALANRSMSAAEEFWLVLQIADRPMDLSSINWPLFGCIIAAWILTALCMIKGIKSTGKVVYVTAVTPYIFITIILIRGCTLTGAWIGIKFYLLPDWNRLKNLEIWTAAAKQIFYSLGPSWGGLITFASYNKFNHNCYRSAILLPIASCATSVYAGFAIFSVIGHMAHASGVDNPNDLMQAGPGLAFVAYPEALAQLPGSCIWAILFFVMLLTLGLDSQFATLETMTSGFIDRFPRQLQRHKSLFIVAVCIGQCLLGLPLVTRGGYYLFLLLDTYATAFSVVFIGLIESLALFYIYGARKLMKNLESMTGAITPFSKSFWYSNWYCLTPLSTAIVIVSAIADHQPPDHQGKSFPAWSLVIGWCTASVSLIPMPLFTLIAICRYRHKLRQIFKPTQDWLDRVRYRSRGFDYTFQVMGHAAEAFELS